MKNVNAGEDGESRIYLFSKQMQGACSVPGLSMFQVLAHFYLLTV